MFIRTKSSKLSPRKTVQIVESFLNDKGLPRQRIVQHIGVAFDDIQLQQLWTMAENLIPTLELRASEEKIAKSGQVPLFHFSAQDYQKEIPEQQTTHVNKMLKIEDILEGPFEVWSEVFDKLAIGDVLGLSDRGRGSTNALKLCIIAKMMGNGSKKHSATWLVDHLGVTLSEDRFYRMMDKLSEKIDKVKDLAFYNGRKLCDNRISLVLFDVTTLYFESFLDDNDEILPEKESSPVTASTTETKEANSQSASNTSSQEGLNLGLRRHGFSKDCKFKETQVVLALAASPEGVPLWYDIFPGNTAECSTLQRMIKEVSKKVKPEEICLVADGAMLTQDNRKVLKEASVDYVLGASVKKLDKVTQKKALDVASFTELDEEEKKYRTIQLKSGNTLIVTWSGKKAKKDAHDREYMIQRLLKKLDKNKEVTAKTLIGNRGTGKYIESANESGEVKYRLNQKKIEEDAKFDGLHAIETDRVISKLEDVKLALNAYGSLWHIEDCFRVSKSALVIRPVYHWTNRRIRAHIAICFLALLMERYLEKHLKVKRHVEMSAQRIKEALMKVNSTLIKDTENDKLYRFPSRLRQDSREIYAALGLKREVTPMEITSMTKYRRRVPNLSETIEESEPEGQSEV